MARFNFLSFIFLLTGIIFLFSGGGDITGYFIGGNFSVNFLNVLGMVFLMLSFIVFMGGKKLEEAILVPTGSHKADKERAHEATEYYQKHEKQHPYVLISGSIDGKFGRRFVSSQPGHIYKYMRTKVPRDAFLFEPKSKNTAENVVYSCKEIKEKGIKKVDVVSNPSHLWRFKFLFDKAKEEGLIDKDVEINYVPTEKNFLFEDVGEAFYGIAHYFNYRRKFGDKSLKSSVRKK